MNLYHRNMILAIEPCRAAARTGTPSATRPMRGSWPSWALPVVELLAPRPGERILDLGCGDGVLTARLAELGLRGGRRRCRSGHGPRGPRARRRRAGRGWRTRCRFEREFDAVFSNAALHWMKADPDAVIAGVGAGAAARRAVRRRVRRPWQCRGDHRGAAGGAGPARARRSGAASRGTSRRRTSIAPAGAARLRGWHDRA